MEDEDLGSQRKKWNETIRAKMLRDLFPNAPKRSRCRICKKTYPNSILLGSSIAQSMCPECITERIGTRRLKKNPSKPVEVKPQVIKEENLMTLKQYLEMKI
jgi:hypothetical protein